MNKTLVTSTSSQKSIVCFQVQLNVDKVKHKKIQVYHQKVKIEQCIEVVKSDVKIRAFPYVVSKSSRFFTVHTPSNVYSLKGKQNIKTYHNIVS